MVSIDVRADIKETAKMLAHYERVAIPKATNRAINTTLRNVRTKIQRYISERTGLKIGEIKEGIRGQRSTLATLRAELVGHGRAVNLIRFVTPGKRQPGAFRNEPGVRANAWRKARTYHGAFIIRGKGHGKPIVVVRTSRSRQPLRGLSGPSVRAEMGRPAATALMKRTAIERFGINFHHDLKYYTSRI